MLSDAQWADLAPLIEEVRPKGKTPPRDLRRTIEALKRRFKSREVRVVSQFEIKGCGCRGL